MSEPALVFAYGTLRDPEYRRALFDHALRARAATLPGWMTVVAAGGYLSIVPASAECVEGDLVVLDVSTLAVADRWEEVPLYQRRAVCVRSGDETVACWVYVRPTTSRRRPPPGALAAHDRATVLAAIRQFRNNSVSA